MSTWTILPREWLLTGLTLSCLAAACDVAMDLTLKGEVTPIGKPCHADVATDVLNCGSCGTVCEAGPNSQATCVDGICGMSCDPGFADCDNAVANGCETDLVMNCGGCSNACSAPHGSGQCLNGVCAILSCDPGYGDCDGAGENGCEVELATDAAHCGSCGVSCLDSSGAGACVDAVCVAMACNPGYTDCDGDVANGCEAHLENDPRNCGACGSVCPEDAFCSYGRCLCPRGGLYCGVPCSEGVSCSTHDLTCTDLKTNPNHCGECGVKCDDISRDSVCQDGVCRCLYESCASGRVCCPDFRPYRTVCMTGTCHYEP